MTGDYTKVPLRNDERWTGARMQQARVLLDHEWNLNLDATARTSEHLAADVIGPAGVVAGSDAFKVLSVGFTPDGAVDIQLGAGHLWAAGMEAVAPSAFRYLDQEGIPPVAASGRGLVYLDVFPEHVQPAEAPADLVDPALAPVDTAARTRVGWRVRVAPTQALTCTAAFEALAPIPGSQATMSIFRTVPGTAPDPCDPPGDPLGVLPDGLLRVEVLDSGSPATARLAWSFENGAAAVAVTDLAADQVTLLPSAAVKFATGDFVELSWLVRRADRLDHGPLYEVANVAPGPAGDIVTLDRPVPAALASAAGLALRRWDGQVVGATSDQIAMLRAIDLGVRFRAAGTTLVAGDWWGARLRESGVSPVEVRTDAPPDGVGHAFAPLALVDLATPAVESDCRPTFVPLTELHFDDVCTVTARPGDDLQAAADSLPASGGELCLAAGVFPLLTPLLISGRQRVVVTGVGPATILRARGREAAVVAEKCTDIEIRHLRIEGGDPGEVLDPHRNGAFTAVACDGVRVVDCELSCPDGGAAHQACLTVRSTEDGRQMPDRVWIEGNRFEVGSWQTGVLVVDSDSTVVAGNHLRVGPPREERLVVRRPELLARSVGGLVRASLTGAADRSSRIGPASPMAPFAEAFAAFASTAPGRATRGPAPLAMAFARFLVAQPVDALDPPARRLLARLFRQLRPALQGIVVAGRRVGTAVIRDNLVEGTVQGIHVGTSDARRTGREIAGEVVVTTNVVHSLVPFAYDRDRHAVFVGNARSVHVLDTVATLERPDDEPGPSLKATGVEGIRVHGVLGPFLVVRQSSLRGFSVGVAVTALPPFPGISARVWYVAETVAAGPNAVKGAVLPGIGSAGGPVVGERNVP